MIHSLQDTSIQFVKGVGPARKKLFMNLGVESIEDLFYLFPRRYEDRRNITPIAQIQVGESQTIIGTVKEYAARKSWYTKKQVTEIVLDDGSGRLFCVWFNQPYLQNYFKDGKKVVCHGKVDVYKNRLQMISPEYEIIESEEDESLSLKRIVPIYPLTKGMTQRYIRKVMKNCLEKFGAQLEDELPVILRNKLKLSNIKRSINSIHFPEDLEQQEEAIKRISFEEFYFFQISVILRRLSLTRKEGIVHTITDSFSLKYIDAFPFELTKAQKKVIREIKTDMQKNTPMLRLLQGDVGSGKTIVALFGCLAAVENGFQAALMAPTEILARQHFENMTQFLKGSPFRSTKIALLVSGLNKKERDKILEDIAAGKIDFVIGTHALITDDVTFKNLSFVVIDEQHKFGVRQRALLAEKGNNPHTLIMTATPIPRTLCITLYGDLDISTIDEIPPGRGKVTTKLFSHENAPAVYEMIRQKVNEGRQAYVVYPIIEESKQDDLQSDIDEHKYDQLLDEKFKVTHLKAAQKMYKHFKTVLFKDKRVGLVHGQLNREETEKVMKDFKAHKIDILVATTVLEVGVDVPNANVMVIEHAERFGLAQLHQMRGRIGRGKHDALCLLISDPTKTDGIQRLEAVCSTTDGFKIAQYDLEIRGPGKFFGRHQHGLNELKIANPATQMDILELARKEAIALTLDDPALQKSENHIIKRIITRRYPTYLAMVNAG
ncbi:MAG: ATP-dependent DNA helicase RecG [Candidatus Omnitrophica bacterium]|nr:ATP-dependent DNA helicase RecG [Candidatus Omnitrophota bacterium]